MKIYYSNKKNHTGLLRVLPVILFSGLTSKILNINNVCHFIGLSYCILELVPI